MLQKTRFDFAPDKIFYKNKNPIIKHLIDFANSTKLYLLYIWMMIIIDALKLASHESPVKGGGNLYFWKIHIKQIKFQFFFIN